MSEEKRVRNALNEAIPQVFNRDGIVKKNPDGQRATGRDFARVMAKTMLIRSQLSNTDNPCKLRIVLPAGSLIVKRSLSDIMIVMGTDEDDQPDIIAALLLNGWNITTTMGGE